MNLFRKNPAIEQVRIHEDFKKSAEAHERLRVIVKELQDVLVEHTDLKNSPVLYDASERLLYMTTRSIPPGPREQFDGSAAECLSSGLISFQGGSVNSLFKQPEHLSKIMDFLETSRAAGAISPFEEMQSVCQLAYASVIST